MTIPSNYTTVPFQRGLLGIMPLLAILDGTGAHIAGGYARWCASPLPNTPLPRDIDVFAPSYKALSIIESRFAKARLRKEHSSDLSTLWYGVYPYYKWPEGFPINLIQPANLVGRTLSCAEPEKLLDGFPFPITQALILDGGNILIHKHFLRDEGRRLITIPANSADPVAAIVHAFKYTARGYTVRSALNAFIRYEQTDATYKAQALQNHAPDKQADYGMPLPDAVGSVSTY
jgi:hypothetical protein